MLPGCRPAARWPLRFPLSEDLRHESRVPQVEPAGQPLRPRHSATPAASPRNTPLLLPVIISGPMIAVSDLGKSFGPQTLFEGVSIQFNPGNRYGLVGANGSGKSTFLKILAGDDIASEGTIAMPKRLKLGVIKQDHFRYEHMPILEVATMGNHDVCEAMVEKERLLAN